MAASDSLINKYRPTTWGDVFGHKAIVASLRDALANQTAHAFCFVGNPGMGKTTLARIVATDLGASPTDILEIPAALYTGVENMRDLCGDLSYVPLTGEVKIIILDECHRLSPQAWDSILKITEEPPKHVFWIFCTSDPRKIPGAMKRRCLWLELPPLTPNELYDFLDEIAGKEGMDDIRVDVLELCADEANGSPGQALANLSVCAAANGYDEAASLLRAAVETNETVALAQALMNGEDWRQMRGVLDSLKDQDPEALRRVTLGYFQKVVLGAERPDRAMAAMVIMEPFAQKVFYHFADVILAVGQIIFSMPTEPEEPRRDRR